MNRWMGVGRLCKDIELRYSNSGVANASVTMAVDGYKKDDVDFIQIKLFGKTAEFAAQYTEKGCLVEVEAKLKNNNYEKDGKKVYKDDVIIDSFRPLTWKKKDDIPGTSKFDDAGNPVGENFPF